MEEKITVEMAMEVIKKELEFDNEPGSYYYGWQSNIACAIMDNSNVKYDKANEIAVKFLNRLIS